MVKRVLLFVSLLSSLLVDAQQKFSFDGYVSEVNMSALALAEGGSSFNENLLNNRLNLRYTPLRGLDLQLGVRNRLLSGMRYNDPLMRQTVSHDLQGPVDMSFNWVDGRGYLLNTTLDRLSFSYTLGAWKLQAGRQRVNWSQCLVWNPNDLFNGYSFFDLDYPERQGTDAVRLSYYLSELSSLELVVNCNAQQRWSGAGLWRFNRWMADFQLLAGVLNEEDGVVGAGFSGEWKEVNIRGEFSCFIPFCDRTSTRSTTYSLSIGADKVLEDGWNLSGELLWNSMAREVRFEGMGTLMNSSFSPKLLSPSEWSVCAQAGYAATPLINVSMATLYYFDWQAFYVAPTIQWDVVEELTLSCSAQLFLFGRSIPQTTDMGLIYCRASYYF